MACSHVDLTGYPAVAWRKATSARVVGRSWVRRCVCTRGPAECLAVWVGESLSAGAFLWCVGGGCVIGAGSKVVRGLATCRAIGSCGGLKLIFHRRGAFVSRVPLRMVAPAESVIMSVFAVKRAVQPASHSVPMLTRLCVRPGTM